MFRVRIKVFLAMMLLGLGAMAVRLWHLQVVRGQDYRRQFEQAIRRVRLLPAPIRGQIIDRHGRILAMDAVCFDIRLDYGFIVSRFLQDGQDESDLWAIHNAWVKRQVSRLAERRQLSLRQARQAFEEEFPRRSARTWQVVEAAASAEELDQSLRRIMRRVNAIRQIVGTDVVEQLQAHPVVRGLNEEQVAEVRLVLDDMVGASVVSSRRRWYPNEDMSPDGRLFTPACHVIGYLGAVDERDQHRHNLTESQADWLTRMLNNYLDGDSLGKVGIEAACEKVLRGRRGYMRYADAEGPPDVFAGVSGSDVKLTLDVELQNRIVRHFPAGSNGSAVVLDVRTGQVLAMVSLPGYDLNSFRGDRAYYAATVGDDRDLPLLHRAVARTYEPGSTAKPVTAIAALSERIIGLGTQYVCQRYLNPSLTSRFRCTSAHGPLEVFGAIRKSCNIFFYHAGENLERRRPGRLCEWFREFGYACRPGTGLPEERQGHLPAEITPGEARSLAIGQGPFLATPLQVANVMATLARGGQFVSPTLLLSPAQPQDQRSLGIAPEHVEVIHRGMNAVTHDGGTAAAAFRSAGLGIEVCGKTGTADTTPHWVDRNGNGRMDQEEIIYEGNLAWFAGFAPYRTPQIAFAVVLEYVEGYGGAVAAPLAVEVIRQCIELGYVSR